MMPLPDVCNLFLDRYADFHRRFSLPSVNTLRLR